MDNYSKIEKIGEGKCQVGIKVSMKIMVILNKWKMAAESADDHDLMTWDFIRGKTRK